METWPFLAVLASALLHAIWNGVVRSAKEPGDAMACAVMVSGFVSLPFLLILGLPAAPSLPWLVAGVVINTIGIRLAMAAYRRASYGLAYPVMRAGIPLLMLPIGFLLLGEWPGMRGAVGVLSIAAALIMLALAARRAGGAELAGFGYALMAAAAGAGYVASDAAGVRLSGDALSYAFLVGVLNAVAIVGLSALEGRNLVRAFPQHANRAMLISALSTGSFVLYIAALSVSPAALASALRETSVLFAVGIARFALGEAIGRYHLAAALLALAGVVGIRLA
jgi:drug/metabolite transporter (DMT)-like permease